MASVPGGRRRVSYPWSYSPLLSDGVDLPCGRGRLPALEPPGTILLCPTCSRPAKAVCWVCPVRSEVSQSAIPIAVRASGRCRMLHRVVRLHSRDSGGI
jgi:hypothetical protein